MTRFRGFVSRLPELPVETFETLGVLDYAQDAPVLTIKPYRPQAPVPPTPPPASIPRSRACSRKYLTQVLYPRVRCYPSPDPGPVGLLALLDQKQPSAVSENEMDLEVVARRERFYKLTQLKGAALGSPHWCTVKYGPWSAIAIEEEACTVGLPNHWTLSVVEIPEIVLEWYGTWQDVPPYPSLQVITGDLTLFKEQCSCCPGFHWCPTTNSCIPVLVDCQDPLPA
jgi:hypothetical protein